MRLPHPLIESQFFQFERLIDVERALGDAEPPSEIAEVRRLAELGLPPVASATTLATLLGLNSGLIWSFVNRTKKHYRSFDIPKGRGFRQINAPRVALKVVQKWLAIQLARNYAAPKHVFGCVPGRSHIDAARIHLGARWVMAADIENFFPSTPRRLVEQALIGMGFNLAGAEVIAALACFDDGLAQGAPCSPILSNLCFAPWDRALEVYSDGKGVRLTRYADDIVVSGTEEYPDGLKEDVVKLLQESPWRVSRAKCAVVHAPTRLKVHGLLVHGDRVRLTKRHRNKIRAYRHLVATKTNLDARFTEKALGHISYARSVSAES